MITVELVRSDLTELKRLLLPKKLTPPHETFELVKLQAKV